MSDNDLQNLANSIVQTTYNVSNTMPKTERFLATITNDNPWTIRRIGANQDLPPEMVRIHKTLLPKYKSIPHMHQYDGITDITSPPNDEALSNAGGAVLPNPHHHTHTHDISLLITHDVHDGINAEDFVIEDIFPSLAIDDIVIVKSYNGNQLYEVDQRETLSEANQEKLNAAIAKLNRNPSPVGGK